MRDIRDELFYFLRQKFFAAAVAVTAACSYGYAVTHESVGIDDTMMGVYLNDGLEPVMGRWTVYLVNKLFRIGEFTPFITELGGVLLLLAAAALFCVLLRRIFGDRIGSSGYTAFACAFISCPFISEVWVYYYHDGVDIGYIFLALSLLSFMGGFPEGEKPRPGQLLASMVFLWVAVGCYESFIIAYIVGVLTILFFQGMAGREELDSRVIRKLFLCGCIMAGCIVLRTLMQKAVVTVFSLQWLSEMAGLRGVSTGLAVFRDENWFPSLSMLMKRYWLVYFVNAVVYFPVAVYVLSMAVHGIASVVCAVKRRNGWYLLLFLGMAAAPVLLSLMVMSEPLYRSCQFMPLFVASAVLLLYFSMKKYLKKSGGALFAVLAGCLVWNQAYESNRNFYIDHLKYEYDKEVLITIAERVNREYGSDAEVIFTGIYNVPYELVKDYCIDYSSGEFQRICRLTDWLDPQLKEKYYGPYGYCFAGEAQYSVIEWGMYAFENPGLELQHFLQMHGYELHVITDDNELRRRAVEFAEGLPEWPEEGAVAEWDGYVIVNF